MLMVELEDNVNTMLNTFRVTFKKVSSKNLFSAFLIEDFGVLICLIERADYTHANEVINKYYSGWRYIFISTNDDLNIERYEILWALMRSGYMVWLRYKHPRQVKNILIGQENIGERIIRKRLKTWNEQPKYKFLIEDNKNVLKNGLIYEYEINPGFFDHIPEEEQEVVLDHDI